MQQIFIKISSSSEFTCHNVSSFKELLFSFLLAQLNSTLFPSSAQFLGVETYILVAVLVSLPCACTRHNLENSNCVFMMSERKLARRRGGRSLQRQQTRHNHTPVLDSVYKDSQSSPVIFIRNTKQ